MWWFVASPTTLVNVPSLQVWSVVYWPCTCSLSHHRLWWCLCVRVVADVDSPQVWTVVCWPCPYCLSHHRLWWCLCDCVVVDVPSLQVWPVACYTYCLSHYRLWWCLYDCVVADVPSLQMWPVACWPCPDCLSYCRLWWCTSLREWLLLHDVHGWKPYHHQPCLWLESWGAYDQWLLWGGGRGRLQWKHQPLSDCIENMTWQVNTSGYKNDIYTSEQT